MSNPCNYISPGPHAPSPVMSTAHPRALSGASGHATSICRPTPQASNATSVLPIACRDRDHRVATTSSADTASLAQPHPKRKVSLWGLTSVPVQYSPERPSSCPPTGVISHQQPHELSSGLDEEIPGLSLLAGLDQNDIATVGLDDEIPGLSLLAKLDQNNLATVNGPLSASSGVPRFFWGAERSSDSRSDTPPLSDGSDYSEDSELDDVMDNIYEVKRMMRTKKKTPHTTKALSQFHPLRNLRPGSNVHKDEKVRWFKKPIHGNTARYRRTIEQSRAARYRGVRGECDRFLMNTGKYDHCLFCKKDTKLQRVLVYAQRCRWRSDGYQ